MKKNLITMALLLTLGLVSPVAAQNGQNPKNEPTELVDSTAKDELEVYSDTTAAAYDSTVVSGPHRIGSTSHISFGLDDFDFGETGKLAAAGGIVLAILFIIFVLCPVAILIVLFYFINKNRKQKLKLAQMAVEKGQPIPDQLLVENKATDTNTYQAGMRQVFLGIGLMVFLGYTAGEIGFGIGALVFFIGLGKVVIAKTNKQEPTDIRP